MVKAMKDGGYADLGCFTHTLQLIVHEGALSQRLVKDTVAICRKIVDHFKHSPLAYSKLKQIQQSLNLPVHHLKQDEPTRWNFYSLHAGECARAENGFRCVLQ